MLYCIGWLLNETLKGSFKGRQEVTDLMIGHGFLSQVCPAVPGRDPHQTQRSSADLISIDRHRKPRAR
jgi:hypothetical protein